MLSGKWGCCHAFLGGLAANRSALPNWRRCLARGQCTRPFRGPERVWDARDMATTPLSGVASVAVALGARTLEYNRQPECLVNDMITIGRLLRTSSRGGCLAALATAELTSGGNECQVLRPPADLFCQRVNWSVNERSLQLAVMHCLCNHVRQCDASEYHTAMPPNLFS